MTRDVERVLRICMTAPWEEKGPSAPRVEHKNYTDEPGSKYAKNPLILFYKVRYKYIKQYI